MKYAILFVLFGLCFAAAAQGQDNSGSRQASCNPGQYVDTSGDQATCRPCPSNAVSNGTTRSCSQCSADTYANSDHSSCLAYPRGTYKDNSKPTPFGGGCQPTGMDGGTLHAKCLDYFGAANDTALPDAAQCVSDKHDIENIDGHLRCVESSTKSPNGHDDVFDIVSKTETDDSSGTTIHWRIDHPNVAQDHTKYPGIVFNAGDEIKYEAGGCAHTNGGEPGQRWKQYVNPPVTFAERNTVDNLWSAVYAGGASLTSTTKDVTPFWIDPFQVLIPTQPPNGLTIPGSGSSSYPQQFVLSLLYYDNIFNDNGYYAHDDGTDGQCKNTGPAWVEASAFRAKKPISYAHFDPKKNFDLTWRTDDRGVDDNNLPLNPLWAYQVEHPGKVPGFQASCIDSFHRLNMPSCTSQNVMFDRDTDLGLETFGYCSTDQTVINGHINWQVVTYQGALFYRAWSGLWPNDDDMNYGLETDNQSGQTSDFEGPDTGIGLEFREEDTTKNYTTVFWKAIEQNAVSQGGFISLNGNQPNEFANGEYGVVTGLMGIDGVHQGYSEVHPVYAMAIQVVWSDSPDGTDETWAFFIRNAGNEGSCSHLPHQWQSGIGDWTYAIQLPWPEGATGVQMVQNSYDSIEMSAPDQKYLGMQGTKPWTILRFKLPSYTQTGIDGEITLHYNGAKHGSSRKIMRRLTPRGTEESDETDLGVNWTALSARITDPKVRAQFLSDVKAIGAGPTSRAPSMTAVPIDLKQANLANNHNSGAWIGQPIADMTGTDTEKANLASAIKALLAKYAKQLNLPAASAQK